MLILIYAFGLSTDVLTEKRLIGGSHDLRTNNTLKTSIYLCCVDEKKQLYMPTLFVIAVPACTHDGGSQDQSYRNIWKGKPQSLTHYWLL